MTSLLPTNMSESFIADIVVIDDMVANLQLLSDMLRREGYKVRPVTSGRLGLQAIRAKAPDLVLLDISMPEMDGFEVCRELKADRELRDIPVVFLSAMSETIDKVRAFGCGAVDYITKPFQFEEVAARVTTHLRLYRAERALSHQLQELRRLEELRDNLVHMVAHDMRGALQAIVCGLGMFPLEHIPKESQYLIDTAQSAALGLASMVTNMLEISRLEAGQVTVNPSLFDLRRLVDEVATLMVPAYPERTVQVDCLDAVVELWADRSLVHRIVQNLVSNALSFTSEGSATVVSIRCRDAGVEVRVTDSGPGIAPERIAGLFEKFSSANSAKGPRPSYGLGLAFCKLATEAQGGRIGCESELGHGSQFWLWLPMPNPILQVLAR